LQEKNALYCEIGKYAVFFKDHFAAAFIFLWYLFVKTYDKCRKSLALREHDLP